MNDYQGIIIEESLLDTSVLKGLKILSTEVEAATPEHQSHVPQWTMHTVQIPEGQAEAVAQRISVSLDGAHRWYADFKNTSRHYIIFKDKVFDIDRTSREQYDEAKKHAEKAYELGYPVYGLRDKMKRIGKW